MKNLVAVTLFAAFVVGGTPGGAWAAEASNDKSAQDSKAEHKAKQMPLGDARNALWAKLDLLFMKNDASWAPFMNRQWPKFVSARLHGLVFNGNYFELFPSMWLSH